jgi:hypothetical protein
VVHTDDATIDDFHELAPGLAALFPLLTTDDPDGMQLIVRGDLPGFEAWLAAGGDVNQAHPESEWALLETAVQWGRTEFVRRLLERGAVVTRTAWEVAKTGNKIPAEARALVLSACPTKPEKPGKKRKKT